MEPSFGPMIGEPIAYGIGFAVLVLYAFADDVVRALVTIAHEGGHMVMAIVTGRGHSGFIVKDNNDGSTTIDDPGFGVGDWFVTFAGYATPPLVGLGGAYMLADGNGWGVLLVGLVLLTAALLQANDWLTRGLVGLALLGVAWAALAGSEQVVAAVAFGLVWLLLIGGVVDVFRASLGDGSDAYWLARRTLIPRIVWQAVWAAIAIASLWIGGRLLLGFA